MEYEEDKLIHKYVEALSEEYEAFYLYKHIWKYQDDKALQGKVLSIMEDELHHYEEVYGMLFPDNGNTVHSQLEHAFKKEMCHMKDEMRACLDKLKKM